MGYAWGRQDFLQALNVTQSVMSSRHIVAVYVLEQHFRSGVEIEEGGGGGVQDRKTIQDRGGKRKEKMVMMQKKTGLSRSLSLVHAIIYQTKNTNISFENYR